jgi:PAS domain S-box-containing protein
MGVSLDKYDELKRELEYVRKELNDTKKELSDVNKLLEDQKKIIDDVYGKLVASEENFRQLAENTNEIIWLRDENEFIYINDQFEIIWGRKKVEIINGPEKLSEWIHPDDRSRVELWFGFSDIVYAQPLIEQYRIVKPDNEIRWLLTRSFLVEDEEGKPYRIVSITSDITEQKDFEETLQVAKEKAQESDLLKTTFLANISHEIRTPMNGIVGFAELLSREDIDFETRNSYLEIMKKSSDQLICIIDDIIDFAKIESNQIRIRHSSVDLNDLMDQLKLFYENELLKNELTEVTLLVEKYTESSFHVLTDENRLRQVFSYLLDNSIKYTNDGFIKFGYKVFGSKIEFFVQDSGNGIPKEKHEVIFERFRQADEGHTRKYGGVGLGLPISKGLVNLLGGTIWMESQPGKGSVFYFTIPYKIEKEVHEGAEVGFVGFMENQWKDKHILVAEDDDLNFEYMKALLEPTEATIVRAKDGNQAIKICSTRDFDLILMDIRLPILNGIQATQHIRDMGKKTPIIAQTAFAMDDDEQKCLAAGCNKYIAKPISKEKLYTTMKELL